ncbi:alpha/beta hydrolase [Bacillaceae bacterium SIJ1]|uniref:alpha/beta fold hydrolase n=1 Tax=Litoribacterium kuwaitense TaxID=1398745 RepID=UPI0013EAF195|nr:alpha/beta hydrolase [Litoribacterium kuwaitense]NGP44295.1 alpha/beta hydrolase [Litoribacterium kuwaitense]
MKPIRGFIDYHRTNIYYEHWPHPNPDAPKAVLVHGFLSSSFSFRHLMPLLHQEYHILTLDLPPFGKSEKSRRLIYSYENYGAIVNALIAQLNWMNCIGIGHSMGGQVLLNAASQKTNRWAGLALLGSSGYLKPVKKFIYYSYIPFFSHLLKYALAKTGVKGNLYNVVYRRSSVTAEMIQGYAEPFKHPKIFPGLVRFLRHREGDLQSETLQRIHLPIRLLWGAHDRVVPLTVGRRLEKDLPQSKLHIFEDAAHLLPEEKPEEMHRQVIDFTRSIHWRQALIL